MSSRITSPDQVRVSSAAQRNTDTARPTSARAQVRGLPLSAVIVAASPSARAAMPALIRASASARACTGRAAASAATSTAARTARSTCSGVAYDVVPTALPSYGLRTTRGRSPCTQAPATNNGIRASSRNLPPFPR